MIAFIDDGVRRILDTLQSLDLREHTILVFTSDHGTFIGEHGVTGKGGMFYDCLVRVPLIISWPGQLPENVVDTNLVSLIDVMPSLLYLTGMDVPDTMQGRLLPVFPNSRPRDAVFAEYGAGGPRVTLETLRSAPRPRNRRQVVTLLREREAEGRPKMVRTQDWKYVYDPLGDIEELYDMRNDPWELENIAAKAENQHVVNEMQRRILDWALQTEDAQPVPLFFQQGSPFRDHPRCASTMPDFPTERES
jgi:arylsulfatase A-like enzyme